MIEDKPKMLSKKKVPVLEMSFLLLSMMMSVVSISAFQLVLSQPHRSSIMIPANAATSISSSSSRSKDLNMVEKKKTKSTRSGGGFGSSSSTIANSHVKKARSISGNHTGAGTKALASAANTFDRIRKLYGKEGTTDVYVRSPKNDESLFWFVGKVVRVLDRENSMEESNVAVDDEVNAEKNNQMEQLLLAGSVYPTISETIVSQKRLILEYAKCELRPQNMGLPQYSPHLELWTAPGDSEMDVARNHVTLVKVDGSSKDLREGFNVNDVGYNPEVRVMFVHSFDAAAICYLASILTLMHLVLLFPDICGRRKGEGRIQSGKRFRG